MQVNNDFQLSLVLMQQARGVDQMFVHRQRLWPNIIPTLDGRVMFSGNMHLNGLLLSMTHVRVLKRLESQ